MVFYATFSQRVLYRRLLLTLANVATIAVFSRIKPYVVQIIYTVPLRQHIVHLLLNNYTDAGNLVLWLCHPNG